MAAKEVAYFLLCRGKRSSGSRNLDSNLNYSDVSQLFKNGLEAQSSNNSNAARAIYEEILILEPQHSEANHNLGVLCVAQNEYLKALELFKTALGISPNVSLFWASYIDTLIKLNRITDAKAIAQAAKESGLFCARVQSLYHFLEKQYQDPTREEAVKLDELLLKGKYKQAVKRCLGLFKPYPNSSIICLALGDAYRELGKIDQAIASYKKVAEYQAENTQGFVRLGELYTKIEDIEAAIANFQKALKIDPQDDVICHLLAQSFVSKDDNNQARKYFKKAIKIAPQNAYHHSSLGLLLEKQNEHKSAAASFRKAIKILPNDSNLHAHLGISLMKIDRKNAVKSFEKCIEIDPNRLDVLSSLGCVLNEMSCYSDAKIKLNRALDLDPHYYDAHHNLAVNYSHLGDSQAAISSLKTALKYATPNDASKSETILGMELLRNLDFKNGWPALEGRWNSGQDATYINTSKPLWDPTRKDDRVFLWEEQGLGDLVMYSSLIEELRNSVGQLIFQVDQRLIPLFQRSFSEDIRFIPQQRKVFELEYDSHIPIGSLPLHFRPSLKSFEKTSGRYLQHNAELTKKIKSKLQKNDKREIYGISWRGGSKKHLVNKNKLIQLENLVKIFNHEKVQLVSLQYGDTSEELATLAKNHGINVISVNEICNSQDINGLASLICACDQVVSMDNTTVFLAGALGRPTNVLVPFTSDWRWGSNLSQSYWHSSLRVYKQKKVHDWSYPLKHLKMDLNKI